MTYLQQRMDLVNWKHRGRRLLLALRFGLLRLQRILRLVDGPLVDRMRECLLDTLLEVLHTVGLTGTEHTEESNDERLDVLQCGFFDYQGRMHLPLYL